MTDDRTRHIPEAVRRRVEFFAGRSCAECGREIDGEKLLRHLDHREAFSEGGEHVVFNLDPLCHACNAAKGAGSTARTERLEALREQRDEEIRRYFQETDARIVGNEQLREPQEEGYVALRDAFAERSEGDTLPAIAVLPTGCGKSGLIACAPFGIAEGRVLVVTPNLTIKEGLAEGTLSAPNSFYDFCDVLPPDVHRPRIVTLQRGRVNEEDCLRADIIVTNVQQMQGWLPLFPSDFFDLIIVDEAHHAPAESWQNVNRAFPDAKKIYLTATPFRGDNKSIRAEHVYAYRLADAIAAGYVKNIVRVDAVASEMTFTMEGDTATFSRDEILELREETWFSRGVALSDVCNETIVDRSVQLLEAKRRRGTQNHQIIAAACSIRHAERIAALYRSRGLDAAYVASEGMTMEERERRIRAYDANRLDAMVHVGILGEGYDNPTISIAAIFRPFRSTAPYTQFVGRAIRALPDGNATDNLAHVVAHAGLNQEELWGYFKNEVEEAEILADIDAVDMDAAGADEDSGPDVDDAENAATQQRDEDPPEVTREEIEGFDVDAYLPVEEADEARRRLQQMEEALDALREKGLNVPDADDLKQQIAAMNRPMGDEDLPAPPTRPDRERHAYRTILDHAVKRAAGTVLHRLDIPAGSALDADLAEAVGSGDEDSNYEVVIRLLNRTLNRAMGKPVGDGAPSGRNEWLVDELKAAKQEVPAARDRVAERIRAATSYTDSGDADDEETGSSGDAVWDDVDWGEPF
jgi:superfamily II DNA or RNA helicase